MTGLLERVRQHVSNGTLRPLELALADWCMRHGGCELTALGLVLASHAVADGHSCLVLPDNGPALPGEPAECSVAEFNDALRASPLVSDGTGAAPMVLQDDRLYLHRYWRYERSLAARLRHMLATPPDDIDLAPLGEEGGLFDGGWVRSGEPNWQAVAAAVALRHRLTVISGGPGTGKTYTVLRLVHLLLKAARRRGETPPTIRLAAPTGKAAARMMESMLRGLEALPAGEDLREHLPEKATTLHRLLGIGWGTVLPRFDAEHPLAADVVIVDEASMIDLPLMAKLTAALPDHCRLILLGDRYQLASVESGSVLAELCSAAGVNDFTSAQLQALVPLLTAAPSDPAADDLPMADHVVTLQTSHRFTAQSAIGRLAAAVNEGDAGAALAVTREGDAVVRFEPAGDIDGLVAELAAQFQPLHDANDPQEALAALDGVRLLTVTRVGPFGAQAMNRRVFERLVERLGLDRARTWYHGRPVIVLRNDYRAGLFNGDTGVCLADPDGQLRVWFRTEAGLQMLLPSSVPAHESAYAMTVHKSQGSEFDRVWLLLPPTDNPVLSRELLYTGITRARSEVRLVGDERVLRGALGRVVSRDSGLAQRLRVVERPAMSSS